MLTEIRVTRHCPPAARRLATLTLLAALSLLVTSGCSRQFWRRQGDRDAYKATAEKLNNPHWQVPRFSLTPDSRSRFFDPYDPDCGPLPPDDPAAHEFMHRVNGRRGYKNWHKMGRSLSIENPQWLEPFGIAVQGADPVIGHSRVVLEEQTLPDTVELSYIHSREYQSAIEDLYLSALALTLERFRLGVRYLGVNGTEPGASLFSTTRRNGRTTGTLNSNFGVSQVLPTGGQIAVELANSTLWLFGSPGSSSASSLSYSLTQPLMFRAGRKIALEPLTQAERSVLYQARNLARFRQTLFTATAQSYLTMLQQRQNIRNSENNIRQLKERVAAQEALDKRPPGDIHDPLERLPEGLVIPPELSGQLRYSNGDLNWTGPMTESQREQLLGLSDDPAFQAAAQQIVNYLVGDVTSLSAAQLKTNYNTAQSQLENFRRQLADQQDAFKIAIGLPPNIDLQIQEGPLLAPFELISQALIETEARFRELQLESGTALLPADEKDLMPGMIELADLRIYIAGLTEVRDQLYATGLAQVNEDFAEIEDILKRTSADWTIREPGKRYFSTEDERRRVVTDISRDLRAYREKERDFAILSASLTQLSDMLNVTDIGQLNHMMDSNGDGAIQDSEVPEVLQRSLDKATRAPGYQMKIRDVLSAIRNKGFNLREKLTSVAQSLEVIQAGVRVECIALNHFTIQGLPDDPDVEQVVQIGLEQRHDLMNARARVMDRRRAVEIAANQLEAALDVRINGTAGLSHQNQGISNYQAGLNFTTPLDQVIERNTYNTAIVNYQRERRAYMLLEDQIKQQIRQSWRQIQVQATRVEFDRQTVRNAAMQYENAAMQATGAGQTNALNLLNALNAIVNAQNSLVGDWVTYETNRLNIFRDMGIMEIDPRGVWVDQFYLQMDNVPASGAPAADPATSEVPQLPDLTSDAIPPVSEPLTE